MRLCGSTHRSKRLGYWFFLFVMGQKTNKHVFDDTVLILAERDTLPYRVRSK